MAQRREREARSPSPSTAETQSRPPARSTQRRSDAETGRKRALRKACHPEERSRACPERMRGKGSASTKALPALGQIPPLAPLAFGMTVEGGRFAFSPRGRWKLTVDS